MVPKPEYRTAWSFPHVQGIPTVVLMLVNAKSVCSEAHVQCSVMCELVGGSLRIWPQELDSWPKLDVLEALWRPAVVVGPVGMA